MSRRNVELVESIYREFGQDWTRAAPSADLERRADPEVEVDLSRRQLNPAL